MRKLTAILFLFGIFFFSYSDYAQNSTDNGNGFNNTIQNLSSDAAREYVEPVVPSFGSNLNTGWITKAPTPTKFSFSLDIKIIAMGTVLNDDQRTFSTTGTFRFTDQQATELLNKSNVPLQYYDEIKSQLLNTNFTVGISGPTIVGSELDTVRINFPGASFKASNNVTYNVNPQSITLKNVIGYLNDISMFPTTTLQLGIGTFMGTNVAVRWFPKVNIKDLGDFTYWGFGIMHNPAVWFNDQFPVDIALGYFYQDLKVGSIFETKAHMFGIYASKTYGTIIGFTPYIGLSTESSTTSINYDYEYSVIVNGNPVQQTTNINFELDGANSTAFTVGLAFLLAILNLNVDYKFAKVKTASAGLTFGF